MMDSHFKEAVNNNDTFKYSCIKNRLYYLTQSLPLIIQEEGCSYADMSWGQYVIYKQSLEIFDAILQEIEQLMKDNQDVSLFFYPKGSTTPYNLIQSAIVFNTSKEKNVILNKLLDFYKKHDLDLNGKVGANALNYAFFKKSICSAQLLIKYGASMLFEDADNPSSMPILSFLVSFNDDENIEEIYKSLFDNATMTEDILKQFAVMKANDESLKNTMESIQGTAMKLIYNYDQQATKNVIQNEQGELGNTDHAQAASHEVHNCHECQSDDNVRQCPTCKNFFCEEHIQTHKCS